MAKRSGPSKAGNKNNPSHNDSVSENSGFDSMKKYFFHMQAAPMIGESTHSFQMLPAAFFTAVVIIITRMHTYERPMDQFFWYFGDNSLTDFFSYYKMVAIVICAVLALILLLYRVFIQSFAVKRSVLYLPMALYSLLVLLSYAFSKYKVFSLWGFNDRFEGTITLLAYITMLFYIINSVNSEKNVKQIVYSIAASSTLLSLIGLSQALDHDFFRTTLGKKLITPSWFWNQLDKLNFTFQEKQIYQTVYNINYVSFYLTLLIPLFGMLFIRSVMKGKEEAIWKKIAWGALFALLIFNLIGSASSGGLLGMFFVVLAGIIVLNKRILQWWKPVLILIVLSLIISGATYQRWVPELTNTFTAAGVEDITTNELETPDVTTTEEAIEAALAAASASNSANHKIDFMKTSGSSILISYDSNLVEFKTYWEDSTAIKVADSNGASLPLVPTEVNPFYKVDDSRFPEFTVRPAIDDAENHYFIIGINGKDWPFQLTENGPKYVVGSERLIDLRDIPAIGWENNQDFGSGRGYIWSRTIPMMMETTLLGHGADTYCIYFPQDDYIGKYNSGTFSSNINIIVDKPHNMYFGAFIGTGGLSVLALLLLWGIYLVQSFRIYFRLRFENFVSFVGAGIFFGICGFLVSGLVDDSTVSVMPLFYGLLGTGIAINIMLKKHSDDKEISPSK